MSLLSWFGIGNSAGNGLANVVTAANDVASQWISNPGERAAQVDKIMEAARRDVESARNFGGAMPGDTGFSAFADGINKLIRPVLALGVIGILYHVLPLPNLANAPEWVKALGYSVFGFYFGVVSVVDDLPRGIGKLISIIRK